MTYPLSYVKEMFMNLFFSTHQCVICLLLEGSALVICHDTSSMPPKNDARDSFTGVAEETATTLKPFKAARTSV